MQGLHVRKDFRMVHEDLQDTTMRGGEESENLCPLQ
jgi:hypothetical protein